MFKDKVFLNNLPLQPGVYLMKGEQQEVLYVGKARELKKRVSSYFSGRAKDLKTQHLLEQVHHIEVTITPTEHEALLLECTLIKKFRPRYNVLLRDDKSYPYILITADQPYPRILFYRGAKKGKGLYFGPYPNSTAVRETIHLIQKLFHLRSCNDSFFAHRQRPCLQYQIGLCSGSCTGLISPEEYQQNVQHALLFLKGKSQLIITQLRQKMEVAAKALNFEFAAKLRDQVAYLEEIQGKEFVSTLHSDADVIGLAMQSGLACIYLLSFRDGRLMGSRSYFPSVPSNALPGEIVSAFISQHYVGVQAAEDLAQELVMGELIEDREWLEKVLNEKIIKPIRGERRKWLELAQTNAQQSLGERLIQKANIQERLGALQQALQLKQLPHRIECFDISHSLGEETVASCVVFNREGPLKSDYRRFNIAGITPGDDVAAMRQALFKRFGRKAEQDLVEWVGGKPLPELILIDGGKAQLAAALQVLAELKLKGMVVIGVAKGEGRKPGLESLHRPEQPPLHLAPDSLALHFIQQIRDEAHRFAISGHRQRRDKKRRTSILESIPGIGAKRRRDLLRHFGGLQGIEAATVQQLAAVPGITPALAEKLFALFKH